MRYFKQVNFVFLIVGHTKNAAGRIFNLLKLKYHKVNVHPTEELFHVLNASGHVTVHPTKPEDFADCNTFLSLFYGKYSQPESGGLIKQNHIFSCNYSQDRTGNQLVVNLQKSNLDEHKVAKHRSLNKGFLEGRRTPRD